MSIFQVTEGRLVNFAFKITGSAAVTIVDATGATTGGQVHVPRFQVCENNGSTPTLTVKVTDGTNSYLLGSGGVAYNAKALTAGQCVEFGDGYIVPNGWKLQVTSGDAAGRMDVTGVKIGRGSNAN